MYKTKIDYLNEQIMILKRQNYKLQCMLTQQSEDSTKSFVFQLKQQNQQLSNKIQQLNDELLLEKQSRLIESSNYQQSIEQYNSLIFQMKQQIKRYESILKEQPKIQQNLGLIQKWVRTKIGMDQNQMFHRYADPILFFNILEELLQIKQDQTDSTMEERQRSFNQVQKSGSALRQQNNMSQQNKWFQQQSQIYFIRKKRGENLRLNLQKAKLIQLNYNRALFKDSKEQPLGNHKLLKQSYVNLIADYQKLRKRLVLFEKYIRQLESRNALLIQSNIKSND